MGKDYKSPAYRRPINLLKSEHISTDTKTKKTKKKQQGLRETDKTKNIKKDDVDGDGEER